MPASEHADMYESVKESRRLCFEIESLSFEDAIKVTDKVCNLYLDEAYIVPLYFEKIQYVKNPKLKGLNLYKFSWGPLPFNFKYLNLED
jgi:hypothetical protein